MKLGRSFFVNIHLAVKAEARTDCSAGHGAAWHAIKSSREILRKHENELFLF